MEKGRDLLDNSKLTKIHPELEETFFGTSALLGDLIFAKRMDFGYTQQELAKKADVSLKTIARAEGGGGNLSIESYEKIFHVLDINLMEMIRDYLAKNEHAATNF